MKKHLQRLAGGVALAALATQSGLAASGTITVLDGLSVQQKYQVTILAGNILMGNQAVCDPTSGTCAPVSSSGVRVDPSNVTSPVSIQGTPAVTISGTPSVSLSGASTVTANAGSGTFTTSDSHLPAAAALSDALSNPTTVQIGDSLLGWDATNSVWRRVQVDAASGTIKVDPGTVTVTGTVTTSPPSNASTNVAQFGGTNVVTGTGPSGSGIPRVTVSQDSKVEPWDGTNVPAVKGSGTNAATTDNAETVALSPNPSTVCPNVIPISQTASTDLHTSTNKLHICSFLLVSATAQSVSLVEGTGTTCATGTAALIGGTSASASLAANGGWAMEADRAFLETQTTGDHLCLLQSGSGNVSGEISYVDHN